MKLRPVDAIGDVLPVLSSGDMVSGPEAVALLVKYRLSLLRGEWWENPNLGFGILDTLRFSRLTEADAPTLASSITDYIRNTLGVQEAGDVRFSVTGRQFRYECIVRTKEGAAPVEYESYV